MDTDQIKAIAERLRNATEWLHGTPLKAADALESLLAERDRLRAALTELVASDERARKSGLSKYQRGSPLDEMWKAARAAIGAAHD